MSQAVSQQIESRFRESFGNSAGCTSGPLACFPVVLLTTAVS
ncbi:MAG: hypothetical protein Ct9H300mP1_19950 [Planctomycetaceae bacterium]|nr:MAG: hypothetical protein Ct9H300mP1_19950 [Planctomycetaceae bacterium]